MVWNFRPETFYAYIHRFFSISPIHGCTYIAFARNWVDATIWLAALIFCVVMCCVNTNSLINSFQAIPTAVALDMMRNNTLNLPKAAWCFDIFRMTVIPAITSGYNELGLNITLKKVLAHGTSLSTLPLTNPGFDYIMKTTYLMLMAITDYDIGVPGNQLNGTALRAVNIVESFYSTNGYALPNLVEETARYLCKQTQPTALGGCTMQYYSHGVTYSSKCVDVCSFGTLTWFAQGPNAVDNMCFLIAPALGSNLFGTTSDLFAAEPFMISQATQLVGEWADNYGQVTGPTIGYGPPMAYLDARGWEGLIDLRYSDSVTYINDNTWSAVGIEVVSTYTAYNNSVNPCQGESEAECAMNCLIKTRLASSDACWPLVTYRLLGTKPPATAICNRTYMPAEATADSVSDQTLSRWYSCLYTSCALRPCNQIAYQFKPETSGSAVGITVTLYGSKFVYPAYQEVLLMDTITFLASLGGVLGLWIGSSLIAIFHIAGYAVTSTVIAVQKRRRQKEVIAVKN